MAYQSFFSANTATKPGTAPKAGNGYTSFFGNSVQKNNTYAAAADDQKKKQQAQQPKQVVQAPEQPKQSLFSKVKTAGKQLVTDAVHIGEKSVNTTAAGVGGVVGAATAGVQAATGNKDAAKKTIASTNKNVDALLTHGVGNQGGYISAKDAAGSSPKAVVKGIVKGATDITPFVVPGAKGGSLLSKVGRDATANAIVGAGGTAAQEKLNGQKLDAKEIAKGAAVNAAFAVGAHGVTAGTKGVIGKFGKNKNVPVEPEVPTATHETPQPGDVIQPSKPGLDPATSAALQDTMATARKPKSMIDAETAKQQAGPQSGVAIQPTKAAARGKSAGVVDETSAPIVAKPEHVQAVNDYINRANTENPVFQQTAKGIADDLGLKYKGGPVKSPERALTKVIEDYNGDVNGLKDSVRGTIEVPDHSAASFDKVINKIKEKYEVVQIKDNYKTYKNGYADVKVTVKTPGGHTAELILATPEMLQAKNTGGHALYEIWRDTSKSKGERQAAYDQMNTLYGNAHDAANKRLASSSGTPLTETKALSAAASDTGAPAPSRTPGKESDLPVKTTVSRTQPSGSGVTASTTSSSVMKKSLAGEGDAVSIPTSVSEKTAQVKGKQDTPQSAFRSRVYERLQQEQPEVLKGDVKYEGVNLKQDAEKAVTLVESDKNKAYRVAMGHEASSDVTATSVNIALAEKALADGNHSLYGQLVKNRSLRLTRAGQEIVAEKGSVTDNSTSRYVKELVNARLGKLGDSYLSDLKTKVGKSSTKERAISQIDREVSKAQRKIAGKQIDLKAAQDLIDKLAC